MTPDTYFINFSVARLDRACAFYEEILGYRSVLEGAVQCENHRRLWRMEPHLHGHFLEMKQDSDAPALRLIEFDRQGSSIWGRYLHLGDMGMFCLDLTATSVDLSQRINANGGRPRTHKLQTGYEGFQFFDPDGVLCIIHGDGGSKDQVQTVSLHIRDPERSRSFYEGLGFHVISDESSPDYGAFLGLPAGVAVRSIVMRQSGSEAAGLRLLHYPGIHGRSLRGRAIPPNRGLLSLGFPTQSIENSCMQTDTLIKRYGGCHVAGPLAIEGRDSARQSATFLGPDGEMLEFCQV